jgi:hypothetical protein
MLLQQAIHTKGLQLACRLRDAPTWQDTGATLSCSAVLKLCYCAQARARQAYDAGL